MNIDDFVRKTDDISAQARSTNDSAEKEALTNAFFDAAIDFFNENLTGDVALADGRTVFIPAIES